MPMVYSAALLPALIIPIRGSAQNMQSVTQIRDVQKNDIIQVGDCQIYKGKSLKQVLGIDYPIQGITKYIGLDMNVLIWPHVVLQCDNKILVAYVDKEKGAFRRPNDSNNRDYNLSLIRIAELNGSVEQGNATLKKLDPKKTKKMLENGNLGDALINEAIKLP